MVKAIPDEILPHKKNTAVLILVFLQVDKIILIDYIHIVP